MLKEHRCPYCGEPFFIEICTSGDLDRFVNERYCKFCNICFKHKDDTDWSRELRREHLSNCAHDQNRHVYKKMGRPKIK